MNEFDFLRVRCASPKIFLADCKKNADIICAEIQKAEEIGASVLLFPQLAVSGATCESLFCNADLLNSAKAALKKIASCAKSALVVVGAPLFCGGKIFNAAALAQNGKILAFVAKKNLNPAERLYFSPPQDECEFCAEFGAPVFSDLILCGKNAKIQIQFDLDFSKNCGANVFLALLSEGEAAFSSENRAMAAEVFSRQSGAIFAYCNSGAGESSADFAFSGDCGIFERGQALAQNPPFSSENSATADADLGATFFSQKNAPFDAVSVEKIDLTLPNLKKSPLLRDLSAFPFAEGRDLRELAKNAFQIQARALARRAEHIGAKSLVLGISGGADSTLAFLVCLEALKILRRPAQDLLAVSMPSEANSARTKGNAANLAKLCGATFREIPIKESVALHLQEIGWRGEKNAAYENAQARERTQILMDLANLAGGIVVGTGDMSEAALGWCTFAGDQISNYNVNGAVPKTLVLAEISEVSQNFEPKIRKILADVLETPISPELLPAKSGEISQKTEEILGSFAVIDFFLYYSAKFGFSREKIEFLARNAFKNSPLQAEIEKVSQNFFRRFFSQSFKRNCATDCPAVCSVAFSRLNGFKTPSDCNF